MVSHSHTAEYPDVPPDLPPRSRGVIALLEENCTVCMLCARECPDWCIYIDSHKETLPATTEGGRERQRNVLDRFAIDFSLCMYCGICIEVCPFDALHWSPEFEYAELDIRDLLHEKDAARPVDGDGAAAARRSTRRAAEPEGGRGGAKPPGRAVRHRAAASRDRRPTQRARRAAPRRAVLPARAADRGRRRCSSVTTRQVVHAALWLVIALGALAGCYLVLGAEVVALVQVLVYVGAVVVLVLFALMLTRAPIGRSPDGRHPGRARVAAAVVAVVACGPAGRAAAGRRGPRGSTSTRPARPARSPRTARRGRCSASWVLPFELLSLLLLAALVAALVLSRAGAASRPRRASALIGTSADPVRAGRVLVGDRLYGVLARRNAVLVLIGSS